MSASAARRARTCLVVDDSVTVRRVLRRLLERLGWSVDEAGTGADALQACRDPLPELIMVDWNMPEMDGLAFVKALRAVPDGTKPVVIFCTTNSALPQIEAALGAGADEYIMKPFDEEILRGKLEQTGLL
jgi:two-component system chemotaxis response regulator CheY